MRIRQMTAEDIPAVAQIEKECFSQPWSEQGFLDGMKDAIFFVAEDPQIAGTGCRRRERLPMWQ